jgi:hypothetical protein
MPVLAPKSYVEYRNDIDFSRSYTVSQYFELQVPADELIQDFGYAYERGVFAIPDLPDQDALGTLNLSELLEVMKRTRRKCWKGLICSPFRMKLPIFLSSYVMAWQLRRANKAAIAILFPRYQAEPEERGISTVSTIEPAFLSSPTVLVISLAVNFLVME